MKAISIWASHNSRKAIALLIVAECLKILSGFAIGYNFLPKFSTGVIEASVLGLVLLITFTQVYYQQYAQEMSKHAHYRFRLRSTFIVLLSSLFLAILAGNRLKSINYAENGTTTAFAAVSVRADSVQNNTPPVSLEKKLHKNKKLGLFSKKQLKMTLTATDALAMYCYFY